MALYIYFLPQGNTILEGKKTYYQPFLRDSQTSLPPNYSNLSEKLFYSYGQEQDRKYQIVRKMEKQWVANKQSLTIVMESDAAVRKTSNVTKP